MVNRDELQAMHDLATQARDAAHRAYTIALRLRTTNDGTDTRDAYEALLLTNNVRDRIYDALVTLAATPRPAADMVAVRGPGGTSGVLPADDLRGLAAYVEQGSDICLCGEVHPDGRHV